MIMLCKIGIHQYGKKVWLNSKLLPDEKTPKCIVKFKRCKKCQQAKIGREFIIRGEFHWEKIDDKLLNEHYTGWY